MEFHQFSHLDQEVDVIRERRRQAAMGFPAGPVVSVVARVLTWLVMTVAMLLAWFNAVISQLWIGGGELPRSRPAPGPDRVLVMSIPVLFLLSVISLVSPGSPKALKAFGVVWLVVVGWLVISAVISTF
jgi:hypothetical protein